MKKAVKAPNTIIPVPIIKKEYDEKHAVEIMKFLNRDRTGRQAFCDGNLRTENGFHSVHKSIIGAVSEFFYTLFTTEMQEKYDSVNTITTVSGDILDGVIDYIYTGVAKLTEDNVYEMLDAAEFTQVAGLKEECNLYMLKNAAKNNCLKLKAFGTQYSLDEVCEKADSLIAANFADVIQHDDFCQLQPNDVVAVLSLQKSKASEQIVFDSIVRWTNHNPADRKQFFEQFFLLVNLNLIPQDFLTNKVAMETLVIDSEQCRQYLERRGTGRPDPQPPAPSKIAIVSGHDNDQQFITFDIATQKRETWPEMSVGRYGCATARCGWYVYVAGGRVGITNGLKYQSAERFNVRMRTGWEVLPDMLELRQYAAGCGVNDDMYVTGGSCGRTRLRSCEKFDAKLHRWVRIASMGVCRTEHAMVNLDGVIYAIGGFNGLKNTDTVERYDYYDDEWIEVAPMEIPRNGIAAAAWDGHIYVTGGWTDDRIVDTVQRYDPLTNVWTYLKPMQFPRCAHGLCAVNNRLYMTGGYQGDEGYFTTVDVYDRAKDSWSIVFEMNQVFPESKFTSF